jgi:acyl transferase domain-containing protein
VTGRLQPKLAPSSLGAPGTARAIPTPSLKGRTVVPFAPPRPAIQLKSLAPQAPAAAAPTAVAPTPAPDLANLEAREQRLAELEGAERRIAKRLADLDHREQDLADLGKSLKIRDSALKERETIVAAAEARLLERLSKPLGKSPDS